MTRIGFIGLGKMGLPMAVNLVKAGHDVLGYDMQPSANDAFVNAGGKVANSATAAAKDREVVITMLQTGAQVEGVMLGTLGILSMLPQGSLYIDCSTIDLATSLRIHQFADEKRIFSLDAPVSGGVIGAKNASLTFMVGGNEQAYQRGWSLLQAMGKKIIYAGSNGLGLVAKICNNSMLAIAMIATSEAFVLADKLGLSRDKLFEVLTNASGNNWVIENYVPVPELLQNVPANNHYIPGFATEMMLKDLNLARQVANENGVTLKMTQLAEMQYQKFNDEGNRFLDFSAIIKMIEAQSKTTN